MRRDVMLINPSSKSFLRNSGDRTPLGLLYIASTLRHNGHRVRVMDLDHMGYNRFVDEVMQEPPEYAGVSCYTSPMYPQAVKIGKLLKNKCTTVVGGIHATAMPETLTPYFDIVVKGEGEEAMTYIVDNNIESGIIEAEPVDIKRVIHPARHLIDMSKYTLRQDGRPTATSITSRGCINRCVFCSNQDRQMRYHSNHFVREEIKDLKHYGFNDVYFYDDAFTVNKKRTLELAEVIGKEDINFRVTTRAKSLDEEVVKALSDAGCTWTSIGIESGVEARLKDVGKNMKPIDNYHAIQLLTKYGIKSKGFFMFGLPNESEEDAMKTIEFAKLLKGEGLSSADFYIMTPFPGTPIWDNPGQFDITITNKDFTKYLEAGKISPKAFHKTKYMDESQIEKMRNLAEETWRS
jgi:radical SAM superfamily enzyme YgiQ (UPF0313 family)